MKKIIFPLLLAAMFMPNVAMSVGRNHPDRFKGIVKGGKAKKPYAYCDKGWNVRIVGPITEVNDKLAYSSKRVTLECSKTTGKWVKTSAKNPKCPPLTSRRGGEMSNGSDICAAGPPAPANIGVPAFGCGGPNFRYRTRKGKRDRCERMKFTTKNGPVRIKR